MGSIFKKAEVGFYDSGNLDSFGRLRVSETSQRLDTEFIYGKQEAIFDEVIAGAGAVSQDSSSRDLNLSANGTTTGDYAGMYSYDVPYTPGNSQLISITGALDNQALGGGTAQLFLRSKVTGSVVEQVIDESSWDSPISGLDLSKSQILQMDFQSLKVGRIRFYINEGGIAKCIHQIENDNIRSTGFWQLPSLPVYWRIYNDSTYTYMEMGYGDTDNGIGIRYRIVKSAAATLRAICATVKSEGGKDLLDITGFNRSISMGVTKKTVATTLIPLISIRPKTTWKSVNNRVLAIPLGLSVEVDNPIRLVVVHNPVLTGASWVDVDTTQSSLEYDVTATSYSNGHVIHSEYMGTGKNVATSGGNLLGRAILWNRRGSETGILTIAAVRTGATSSKSLALFNWREIR